MWEEALKYGTCICNTIMEQYRPAAKLRHEGKFHYHQGVFLSGVEKFNRFVKKEAYFQYAKDWMDSILRPAGTIHNLSAYEMRKTRLDDLQASILLFHVLETTGDPFYKHILDEIIDVFSTYPCNEEGGFWHMECYPDQMWLDGLYMAGPLLTEYAAKFNRPELFDRVTLQAKLMYKHCYDPVVGLMKHGWDCSKKAEWADAETGVSPEFWCRAQGWYMVAITDILEYLPKDHKDYQTLLDILRELSKSIIRYQSKENGLWYQVLNKGDREDNWQETSSSMMFTMVLFRSIKRGFLSAEYLSYAEKGLQGVLGRVRLDGDFGEVTEVCAGTMIGDYDYYIARERRTNDLHGCGAFLLLMASVLEYMEET